MGGNIKLTMWRESVSEYCNKKKIPYKVPKKDTVEYTAIKKIYANKCCVYDCDCKAK